MRNTTATAVATCPAPAGMGKMDGHLELAVTEFETTYDRSGHSLPATWDQDGALDHAATDLAESNGSSAIETKPTFEVVLERYQAEIFRYAMQLTRNPADADDLYQETMMKAFRAYGRLDNDANVRAWIYRIATNTFLSDRRKHGRVDLLDDVAAQAIPAAQTDHAAGLDARALLEEVAVFVDQLPPKQRVALTLRKYHELGYAEIADALRCSEAAARASVHEALRKLRDCFGDRL
jgi:RNA polymerase sigma factor (sigma-70 family)